MATPKTRSDEVSKSNPASGTSYFERTFAASYYSNRENGQVVKRESPCDMRTGVIQKLYGGTPTSGGRANDFEPYVKFVGPWSAESSGVYPRAYSKFKEALGNPSSEVLLNIVEANKSLEMIAARAFQLRNLVSSLRRGRLGDAWNYMTLNPDSSYLQTKNGRRRDSRFVSGTQRERSADSARKHRQLVKDLGAVILEVRYGWAPLMQDILSAIEVLGKEYEPARVRAGASRSFSTSVRDYNNKSVVISAHERVTLRAIVKVSNPNLHLANSLGFLNPASVIWETVPFSFLVDWALPIGPKLSSLSDFLGLEFTECSMTGTVSAYADKVSGYGYDLSDGSFREFKPLLATYNKKLVRKVGFAYLPSPPLVWNPRLSPGRAINAVALLASTLVNPRAAADVRLGRK